jgi:hypothetical protein
LGKLERQNDKGSSFGVSPSKWVNNENGGATHLWSMKRKSK